MDEASVILKLYSYTAEEQRVFPYVATYMRLVSRKLPALIDSDAGRLRFMLAGLFLTHRACNHVGTGMTTDLNDNSVHNLHFERLREFKRITGRAIGSTKEYLRLIGGIRFFAESALTGPGRSLYRFVVSGGGVEK